MKVYFGTRLPSGCVVRVSDPQARPTDRLLPLRLDLRNHSPTGFEWGYGGSGPAQLALAILADSLGDALAVGLYQRFKWRVIVGLPKAGWSLSELEVRQWLHALGQAENKKRD